LNRRDSLLMEPSGNTANAENVSDAPIFSNDVAGVMVNIVGGVPGGDVVGAVGGVGE
jgi:hypothetical protein